MTTNNVYRPGEEDLSHGTNGPYLCPLDTNGNRPQRGAARMHQFPKDGWPAGLDKFEARQYKSPWIWYVVYNTYEKPQPFCAECMITYSNINFLVSRVQQVFEGQWSDRARIFHHKTLKTSLIEGHGKMGNHPDIATIELDCKECVVPRMPGESCIKQVGRDFIEQPKFHQTRASAAVALWRQRYNNGDDV